MTLDEIRDALETADGLPARALAAAVTQAAALAPEIIVLAHKAADGVYLMPRQENLLFFGLHALAAARETSAYPSLVALLRLPEEKIDHLIGDTATDMATKTLLALYDGDPEPLFAAAEDTKADGSARWGVFQALARLTWEGRIPRERMIDLLDRFERKGMAEPDNLAWMGWETAIALLGLGEFAPRVERGWQAGRLPFNTEPDHEEWRDRLRHAVENPDDPQRFIDDDVTIMGDPVDFLSWIATRNSLSEPKPMADDEPDDPAEDIKLTLGELDWLAGFLVSEHVSDASMTLDELDGFFTALIARSEVVPPSEYLPSIWGGEGEDGPVFDNEAQAQFVMGLLTRHWNTIAARLDAGRPHAPLVYPNDDGRGWATGFVGGLALRQDTWLDMLQDEEAAMPVMSILGLIADEYDAEAERLTTEVRAQVIELLPMTILAIHHFWRHGTSMPLHRKPVRVAKVGRNEPCPCGSGRKYKKCCGSAAG